MIEQAFKMIDDFLNGNYDALDFSYDFPDYLIEKYDIMEKENKHINDIFNDNMPEICAEYEIGESPEKFKRKIKAEYDRILKAVR